jgi:molecular chaperone GrpE
MSSKKATHPVDEPQAETPASESARAVPGPDADAAQPEIPGSERVPAVTAEELEALKRQLDEAQAQAAEYKDGWQRAVAEFSNYRKRLDRENETAYQNAVAAIAKRYLPVLDDLERALATRPADLAWAEGIELICRKLKAILDAEGIQRIEAEGQIFDPNFHEAISQEPSPDHASGQVIEVIRNGYMLGDRVIRPAMVRVAQ